jgi:hypothetical protein
MRNKVRSTRENHPSNAMRKMLRRAGEEVTTSEERRSRRVEKETKAW